jgi:hypothetical protein
MMTTKEARANRRTLAAGMMRLLGLSAGYGETNKYVEQPPSKLTSNGFDGWWEGLLKGSTRSASSIARESGIDGSPLMPELDLYLAVRLTNERCDFAIESE